MLLQLRAQLNSLDVVLASQSPRRQEIFIQLGVKFRVVPSSFAEDLDKTKHTAAEYVMATAKTKGLEVFRNDERAELVVAADTVVVLDGKILEKPPSKAAAKLMLQQLSGRSHTVVTGVSLLFAPRDAELEPAVESSGQLDSAVAVESRGHLDSAVESGQHKHLQPSSKRQKIQTTETKVGHERLPTYVDTFCVSTQVTFAELSAGEIDAYVATGEPMDKAGGYGIQAQGAVLVQSIQGCYFNVMGFPARRFSEAVTDLFLHNSAVQKQQQVKPLDEVSVDSMGMSRTGRSPSAAAEAASAQDGPRAPP
eukprot:gb/GEZN01011438.1/.p1 GENE.gb/GEZN01011438.1/~~gb/GEZN01011438.1/.p1  ORF type:complete len:309 (-),score=68.63 gb/GEZN01011438.1/:201-1127(-)